MRTERVLVLIAALVLLISCGSGDSPAPTEPAIRLPTPTPFEPPTVNITPRGARPTRVIPTPVSTPAVTPTPSPNPTPAHHGWVRSRQAHLRAAPSLEAAVVVTLPAGITLDILGRTADGAWLSVRAHLIDGRTLEGWIATSLVVTFISRDEIPVVPTTSP